MANMLAHTRMIGIFTPIKKSCIHDCDTGQKGSMQTQTRPLFYHQDELRGGIDVDIFVSATKLDGRMVFRAIIQQCVDSFNDRLGIEYEDYSSPFNLAFDLQHCVQRLTRLLCASRSCIPRTTVHKRMHARTQFQVLLIV